MLWILWSLLSKAASSQLYDGPSTVLGVPSGRAEEQGGAKGVVLDGKVQWLVATFKGFERFRPEMESAGLVIFVCFQKSRLPATSAP